MSGLSFWQFIEVTGRQQAKLSNQLQSFRDGLQKAFEMNGEIHWILITSDPCDSQYQSLALDCENLFWAAIKLSFFTFYFHNT